MLLKFNIYAIGTLFCAVCTNWGSSPKGYLFFYSPVLRDRKKCCRTAKTNCKALLCRLPEGVRVYAEWFGLFVAKSIFAVWTFFTSLFKCFMYLYHYSTFHTFFEQLTAVFIYAVNVACSVICICSTSA